MTTWDKHVLRLVLSDPDTPATCREWLEQSEDRKRAEADYARRLREDLLDTMIVNVNRIDDYWRECELQNALIGAALNRVNFRAVARALLNRFCPVRPARSILLPSRN